jgi:2-C-methyl-D-erythritol 4-phosphate cytidylyltransferase
MLQNEELSLAHSASVGNGLQTVEDEVDVHDACRPRVRVRARFVVCILRESPTL